jgi:hypothetical protein
MNNFDDLKSAWLNQEVKLPTASEVVAEARKLKRNILMKNILAVLTLTATMVYIAVVGVHYKFEMMSTRMGIIIILISILGGIVLNSQLLTIALQGNSNANSRDYLQQLLRYRNKQRFMQTTGMAFYFLGLTIGFIFYFYEFYRTSHAIGIIAYSATLLWIAIAWFVLRPRAIKKQEKKLGSMIEKLEQIEAQLHD